MARLLERSERAALRMARHSARNSAAYRTLLGEAGIGATVLADCKDLRSLPVLTKQNTFERFALTELASPHRASTVADILTSSGRGGGAYGFRLTSRKELDSAYFDIDLGLQDAFRVDEIPTLLVNCLPMGVTFRSRAVTVANVSVREDMACAILRDVGLAYRQTLICTDPLFVNRLLAHGCSLGLDWASLNTSVILGEEMLVESQRTYIATKMGIDMDHPELPRAVASSMGVGELGLNLLFETRETIKLRRAMRMRPSLCRLLAGAEDGGRSLPSLFCFNPMRCHVEVLHPDSEGWGELCFTMLSPHALIPLPRYATGDLGRLVSATQLGAASAEIGIQPPWLPMLALKGRIKDRVYGLPSVEEVKEAIYDDAECADALTGAFRLSGASERGVASLVLQAAKSCSQTDHAALAAGVAGRLTAQGCSALEVQVVSVDDFPDRPTIDYERKFAYLS